MSQYHKFALLAIVLLCSSYASAGRGRHNHNDEDEGAEDEVEMTSMPRCGEHEEYVTTDVEDETCLSEERRHCGTVNACRCKEGYVRNFDKCIRRHDCPRRCADPNGVFIETTEGRKRCCGNDPPLCNPVKECRCKPGFLLLHSKDCVRPSECPRCDDPNEEYIMTTKGEKTCFTQEPDSVALFDGCRCKAGWVRHEGCCIKQHDCPKCNDPNAELVETTEGRRRCCGMDPPLVQPVRECRCKEGYYLLHSKVCVPKSDCPTCKDPNEEYIMTYKGEKTCYGQGPDLIDKFDGCRCKRGWVRHAGRCIKKRDCPRCDDPNAEMVTTSEGRRRCCGQDPDLCPPVTECRCKEGFYLLHGKECVRRSECPVCSGEGEVYSMSYAGEKTCTGRNADPMDKLDGCLCKEDMGFVRNLGICIKRDQCPAH